MTKPKWTTATAQGRSLSEHRSEILSLVVAAGGSADVSVFGSVARGDADAHSDIDLLIHMPDRFIEPEDLYRLGDEIGDLVGFDVDVIPLRLLGETIAHDVLRDARRI